jgi:ABC-type nickel/cobalt efflux system permease component RcnA
MIAALAGFGNWLKGIPEWVFVVVLAAIGIYVVRQDARSEGRAEGKRESDERHRAASEAKDEAIRERAEEHEEIANNARRHTGDYGDSSLPDGGADLPSHHYRD